MSRTASSLGTNLTEPAVSIEPRLLLRLEEPRLSMEARDRLLRRSSWLPLLARLARLTGGRPVVCMGAFYYLMSAPIVVLPAYELVRRSLRSFCAGQPAPHGQCSRREGPPTGACGEGSAAPPVRKATSPCGIGLGAYLHDFLERAIEGRSGVSRRDSSWGISAPLWPEAAAPRRHRPRRDRKLRVEEALLLQFGGDARRRVRGELETRRDGRRAQ